ncbi:MAG: hypothetical protein K6E32_01935 [Lachnospiraceae bacterium]|nr:hypothetical protein [Lachnospiraceae bacterium]
MKKTLKTVSALALATILALSPASGNYAEPSEDKNESTEESEENTLPVTSEETSVSSEKAVLNDEVVYVFTDSDGSVNKVMDSVWIEDGTEEENENNTEYDLPVDVSVKYYLDDKEVKASELSGKTGHLKVVVSFTDKKSEDCLINGKHETVYVPFAAAAVTVLDGEKCENVTVSKGRVVFDGNRYAVTGLAFPGLYEDLGSKLDEKLEKASDKFTKADELTFEADVKDCDFPGMYMVVTNSIFNDLKLDSSEELDKLKDDMDKVNEAMDSLMDGSSRLCDGLGELLNGSRKLEDGVKQLSDGLNTLDSNSKALNDGATQVFNALLATASEQLRAKGLTSESLTIANYRTVINGCISTLAGTDAAGTARSQVESAVRGNTQAVAQAVTQAVRTEVEAQVTAGVRESVKAQVLQAVAAETATAYGITEEQALAMPDVQAVIDAKTDENMAGDAVKAQISAITDQKMASDEVKALIAAKTEEQIQKLIDDNFNSAEVQGKIDAGNQAIASGIETLKGLLAQLDSYKTFYNGLNAYTAGVGKAAAGAGSLKSATPDLVAGVDRLYKGEGELKDGLTKFNDEGVGKLNEIMSDDIEGLSERFDAISEVSSEYSKYSEEDKDKAGVKFIYKISNND